MLGGLLWVSVAAWAIGEGWLQLSRPGAGRDPSYVWMIVGSAAGVVGAFAFGHEPRHALPVVAGVAVMWLGMALRYWAVRTLGRFFNVTVGVAEDQRVVDTGPYALVRHPSYTGMLLVYVGLGIALDSWLSVAAALLPTAAVVNRIRHEERELRRELGSGYVAYSARTKRLVPGAW